MGFGRLYIVFIFFIGFSLQAQIVLTEESDSIDLVENEQVKMIKTASSVSFEEIKGKIFSNTYQHTDNPTYKQVIWLRFSVKNPKDQLENYYLYSRSPYFTLYYENDSGVVVKKNGMLTPLKERTNKNSRNILSFQLNPQEENVFFLQIQNGKIAQVNQKPQLGGSLFYYKKLQEDAEYNRPGSVFSIIYFSSLSVIFFFMLMLYIYLKEKVYLYYLLYLFFQILYAQFVYIRSPFDFLNPGVYFPANSTYLAESLQFIFIGFYIFFIQKLMEIKRETLLGKSMRFFAWLCFGYAGIAVLFLALWPSPHTSAILFGVSRGIALPVNLIFIIWIVSKIKHPLLSYFIGAHLFFFAGAVIATVSFIYQLGAPVNSILHFENSYNTIFQAGLLGEVICFAFALALRFRFVQKEKEQHALDYIYQLRENKRIQENMNKALDKKVEEKTKELVKVYSDMKKQREKELKMEFSQKIKEMENLALRSQMNPHFIFNSLNAIKYLIMTDKNERAMQYLDEFSKLLRSVLRNSKMDSVSLDHEITIAKLYLSMEKERLGEDYKFEVKTDDTLKNLQDYPIPSLILQPILENAIWHGLGPSTKKKKVLKLVLEKNEHLKISIIDNGVGRRSKKKLKVNNSIVHHPLGLQITHDRLELFNRMNPYQIKMTIHDLEDSGKPQGTQVTFTYFNNVPNQ